MHLECLEVGVEAQFSGLSSRLTTAQVEVATEKERAKEAIKELEIAQAIVTV